jgi:hypothetical protein
MDPTLNTPPHVREGYFSAQRMRSSKTPPSASKKDDSLTLDQKIERRLQDLQGLSSAWDKDKLKHGNSRNRAAAPLTRAAPVVASPKEEGEREGEGEEAIKLEKVRQVFQELMSSGDLLASPKSNSTTSAAPFLPAVDEEAVDILADRRKEVTKSILTLLAPDDDMLEGEEVEVEVDKVAGDIASPVMVHTRASLPAKTPTRKHRPPTKTPSSHPKTTPTPKRSTTAASTATVVLSAEEKAAIQKKWFAARKKEYAKRAAKDALQFAELKSRVRQEMMLASAKKTKSTGSPETVRKLQLEEGRIKAEKRRELRAAKQFVTHTPPPMLQEWKERSLHSKLKQ